MQLVEQYAKVWGECPTDQLEAKLWIERAGRTCYNSAMPEIQNPDKFLSKVMSHNPPHSSMFEHSNLVLGVTDESILHKYASRWLTVDEIQETRLYGNLRAFMEVLEVDSIDGVMEETAKDGLYPIEPRLRSRAQRRVTVELHTDRNVLAEITRHRDDVAFCVQSQRYVDLKENIEFIKPSWWAEMNFIQQETFVLSCKEAELNYKTLRKALPPQHARTVLTGQVKTIIVMTAYLPEWDWVFKLRRASGAYPQMVNLMNSVYEQFKDLEYVGDN